MFYSQIILAKKGTLGKIWTAAHWGDKKLGRAQIFSTDIATTVDSIVQPSAPLALRLSGTLLLGVVRIYSRQVKYLMQDCQEAMIKIQMAFNSASSSSILSHHSHRIEENEENPEAEEENGHGKKRKRKSQASAAALNVSNFGEFSMTLDPTQAFLDSSGRMLIQPIVLVEHDQDNALPTDAMIEEMFGLVSRSAGGGAAAGAEWFVEDGEDEKNAFPDNNDDNHDDDDDPNSYYTKTKKARESTTSRSRDSRALAAVNLTLDSDLSGMLQGRRSTSFIQDEGWQVFDPDMDDDLIPPGDEHASVDANETRGRHTSRTSSSFSDIERVRAMDDSKSTDFSTRFPRPSMATSDDMMMDHVQTNWDPHQSPLVSENDFPVMQDDDRDISAIPWQDSFHGPPSRDSLESSTRLDEHQSRLSLNMKTLDQDLSFENQEHDEAQNDKDKSTQLKTKRARKNPIPTSGPKRLRHKRKIVHDTAIYLSSDHMRTMLHDTTDIVLQNRSHPADYIPTSPTNTLEEDAHSKNFSFMTRKRRWVLSRDQTIHPSDPEDVSKLSFDVLLTRPNISDSGMLAPTLLNLWLLNAARLRGKDKLPFRMRHAVSSAPKQTSEGKEQEDEEEDEEMETTRKRHVVKEDLDGNNQMSFSTNEPIEDEPEHSFAPFQPDADEFPAVPSPLDESTDPVTMHALPPFTDDAVQYEHSQQSPGDFSLGAVNDLEDDFFGDNEENLDDSGDTSTHYTTSKWHKHTVKVLSMLQKNMRNRDSLSINNDNGEKDEGKVLSYQALTHESSRRTAVAVFFEILQLKTWDFIDLKQTESYGDILIASGPRFLEDPPAA